MNVDQAGHVRFTIYKVQFGASRWSLSTNYPTDSSLQAKTSRVICLQIVSQIPLLNEELAIHKYI